MKTRLYLWDVNNFMTWIDNPEKVEIDIINNPSAVPRFIWGPMNSHPDQWVNGKHVVRWQFVEMED